MKLVIPRLKADQLALTKSWKFNLHHEERNASLGAHFKIKQRFRYPTNGLATEVTLPKGTVMTKIALAGSFQMAKAEQGDIPTFGGSRSAWRSHQALNYSGLSLIFNSWT